MVKVRMNTADVAAEVKCLRKLIGMRLSNVYDISPKTYLFKLMNSSGITESGESEKVLLLMESGVRLHTTEYARDKHTTPSGFTLKLRKHIRTRRLEDVKQLGYDRIILFQFGLGINTHYVILELYAQGNIILTDFEFTVLTLLRSHRDDDKGLAIMSRHRYPIEACRVFEKTDFTKLKSTLTERKLSDADESSELNASYSVSDNQKEQDGVKKNDLPISKKKQNDGKKTDKATLKTILGEALSYGPAIAEHIILDAGLLPSMKVGNDADSKIDEGLLQSLVESVTRFEEWLISVMSGATVPEGYILMQNKTERKELARLQESTPDKIYDEFCPILLNQFKSREYMEFETFDAAADEFYSKIESQRAEQQQKAKEGTAVQKLNKIRLDQENRVLVLKKEVDHCIKMAELIEYNLEDADAAILAVRTALANGMDWVDLTRMIKEERKSGNPVAGLIDNLHFERNCITLLLSNNLDEMDDDEKTSPVDKVEVDLALSAHANARRWFELKKKQETKQEKTVTAHEKAFKAAEKKTRRQLAQEKTVAAITHMRRIHWFEKFNWFISSENYLVISGRDAQQNEMIVKRYMSKGDLYVHAEMHGASSTVIKNHDPEHAIPPLTLNQAGCFTVCHSQAWNAKIVTSAWWVYPHQVSKTAPTGEYLTAGSFMIRGKKNFLPPHPLVMGFGILFRLDESSLASHLNERRVRGEDDGANEMEEEPRKDHNDSDSGEEFAGQGGMDKELVPNSSLSTDNSDVKVDVSRDVAAVLKIATRSGVTVGEEVSAADNIQKGSLSNSDETSQPSISPHLEVLLDEALGVGSAKLSNRSSGLDVRQSSATEDHDGKKATAREKPYVSKAERRKLKKDQMDGNGDAANDLMEKEESKRNSKPGVRAGANDEKPKQTNTKTARGQKGKLKKIKEKYAEQDEEERKIRMALLASAGRALNKVKESQDKEEDPSKVVTGQDDSTKICYKCKKLGHLSRECPEYAEVDHPHRVPTKNVNGDLSENVQDATSDQTIEMDKIEMEEDGIHEIGEEEKEKLNDLDYLTGIPLPDDILLYAVPVCAPYSALQTYKFRVKVTPGTAKKGKAAKSAMNLFSHMPEVSTREKELMKACTDPELVAAIIGNAKITAPGLTQLKQKQKKGKKSGKGN